MNFRESLTRLLKDRVTTSVYRGQVPASLSAYPCVVYHVLAGNTIKSLDGPVALRWADVRLDCLANDAKTASGLADKIIALEGTVVASYDLRWIVLEDEADGEYAPQQQQEKGVERVSVTLKLWI